MSLLANVVSLAGVADETDRSGGGSRILESGLYDATITMAYQKQAPSGAIAVVLHAETSTGQEIKKDLYVTSGTAKGGKSTYTNKKGIEEYLPAFNTVKSLCLLTLGIPMNEVPAEEKIVNIYSFDTKADVPTAVPVMVDLIGKRFTAGIVKQIVDKKTKGDDGIYRATGETREENEIAKIFRADDHLSYAEIMAGATEPNFYNKWGTDNTGVVNDRSTKTAGTSGSTASSGMAGASSGQAKPTKSLFAAKSA